MKPVRKSFAWLLMGALIAAWGFVLHAMHQADHTYSDMSQRTLAISSELQTLYSTSVGVTELLVSSRGTASVGERSPLFAALLTMEAAYSATLARYRHLVAQYFPDESELLDEINARGQVYWRAVRADQRELSPGTQAQFFQAQLELNNSIVRALRQEQHELLEHDEKITAQHAQLAIMLPALLVLTLLSLLGLLWQFLTRTEIEQASQLLLQHSVELNQALLESQAAPLIVFKPDGRVLTASAEVASLCGVTPAEVVAAEQTQIVAWLSQRLANPGESATLLQALQERETITLALNDGSKMRWQATRPSGTANMTMEVWRGEVIESERLAQDRASALNGLLQSKTDEAAADQLRFERALAEKRRVVSRLEESVDRLRGVLQIVADGILMVDRHGEIQFANTEAMRLFASQTKPLLNRPVENILPSFQTWAAEVVKLDSSGQGEAERLWREMVGFQPDGGKVEVDVSVRRLAFFGDEMDIAIVRDLGRTRAVERELISAREVALEASRLKSEFIANMTHEIRTPLNGVLGMLSLLQGAQLGGEQKEFVDIASSSGESLLQLLNEILDFAKIEAGQMVLYEERFDLLELLDDVVGLFAASVNEKQLELAYQLPAEVERYWVGDAARLRQVLVNLIGNAVKFTEHGGITAEVQIVAGGLQFSVHDSGVGIDPDRIDEMFEVFTQVDGSMSRNYGGAGLGLAISRRLVELMGGQIHAESEPGNGSCFVFNCNLSSADGDEVEAIIPELRGSRVCLLGLQQPTLGGLSQLLARAGAHVLEMDGMGDLFPAHQQAVRDGDIAWIFVDGNRAMRELEQLHPKHTRSFRLIALVRPGGERTGAQERSEADATLMKPVRYAGMRQLMQGAVVNWAQPSSQPLANLQDARVLLVEDDEVNQQVTIRLLQRLGVQVDVVANGQAAVEQTALEQHDLILLDCQMPVMDGFTAARAIRSAEAEGKRIPIVALTARVMHGDQERCLEAGMDDYLSKPVTLSALEQKIQRWLGGAGTLHLPEPQEPQATDGERVNRATLLALRDLLEDEISNLLDTYIGDANKRVVRMGELAAQGEVTELGELAHALKGSSLNIGATALAALCDELDTRCRSGNLDDAMARVAEISSVYADTRTTISDFAKEVRPHEPN
jgi:PAS domain S-box-containing protein